MKFLDKYILVSQEEFNSRTTLKKEIPTRTLGTMTLEKGYSGVLKKTVGTMTTAHFVKKDRKSVATMTDRFETKLENNKSGVVIMLPPPGIPDKSGKKRKLVEKDSDKMYDFEWKSV